MTNGEGPVAGYSSEVAANGQPPTRPPIHSTIQFQELSIGQHFEFRGRRYEKLALSMACDEDRIGNIFQAQTEVLPDPFA